MMPDKKRMALVRAKGVCFLCSTCQHWYEGEDAGLLDDMGEPRCSRPKCVGPIWGDSFPEYIGVIEGYKHKFCYLCGANSTHYLWANGQENNKIGLCEAHIPVVKKYTARKTKKGERSLIVAEHVADPDRHEVSK